MANRYEVLWFESDEGESYTVRDTTDGKVIIIPDALGGTIITINPADAMELLDYLNKHLLNQEVSNG